MPEMMVAMSVIDVLLLAKVFMILEFNKTGNHDRK